MLGIDGLSKRYGDLAALREVDLTVERGEVIGLLGRNGAGKTTLISIVAGLLRADAGTVTVAGLDVGGPSPRWRTQVGYCPQEIALYPVLTVEENLRFFGEMAGLRAREATSAVARLMDVLALSPMMRRPVLSLSGGERRRVQVASAVLHAPQLMLLDEPTAGVDVETRHAVVRLVQELARDGSAVIYSTHYSAEVELLDCRTVVMDCGVVLHDGSVGELVGQHQNLESAFLTISAASHARLHEQGAL